MSWNKVSEVGTSSDVDETMPSVDDIAAQIENKRTPKALFEALQTYKRTLQAKRNALIAERAYKRAASRLGPEHVDAFLEGQRVLEEAHAEWEGEFQSPEGERTSLEDHAANWSRKVRW